MEGSTSPRRPIFVMGCPRSGTTFVAEWIGKSCQHTFVEDPHYPVETAEVWELPAANCVVKWCHLFQKADALVARYPDCCFVHVVRRPLDVLYSITHPAEQSSNGRDFGDMRDPDRAVQWWSFHLQGCQKVTAWHRRRCITVECERLPIERLRLQEFLQISLPELPEFQPRTYGDVQLEWSDGHLTIERPRT